MLDRAMNEGSTIEDSHAELPHICCECVEEPFLKQDIKRVGTEMVCSYCRQTEACFSIEELANRIETAFEHHYIRTYDQPDNWQMRLLADRESNYHWYRDGQPVLDAIEEAAAIPHQAAVDVLEVLDDRHSDFDSDAMGDETEFSPDSYYERKGPNAQAWHEDWNEFERSLRTEARFFSRFASGLLARVFSNIDRLKTKPRRPIVLDAGPNKKLTHLYRARVFQSDQGLKDALCRPDMQLGSPPGRHACAGRMNAQGISVFYGATRPSVALAEVRPPVGSKVAIAKFNIVRPLSLLDLTALDGVWDDGSIFDASLIGRLERAAFLQSLGHRITRPVMPDDESFDYLATQAIADFLATENEPRLDGIIFHSAQSKDGRNVALFHKAARVEELVLPDGTEIRAESVRDSEDGREIDYHVVETVPRPDSLDSTSRGAELIGLPPALGPSFGTDSDCRDAALRVDPTTVAVHHVDWVKIHSTRFPVSRSRHEKWTPNHHAD